MRDPIRTARLDVRALAEEDRPRFVELLTDPDFMVYLGPHAESSAHAQVDHLLEVGRDVSFAKQPIVERASGEIVGYIGVDRFDLDGAGELEFGYRLVPAARGRGYATEAGAALLAHAGDVYRGTIYTLIRPDNLPSARVAHKLGFEFWTHRTFDGIGFDVSTWSAAPAAGRTGAAGPP